jgi:hypothetical protein
MPRRYPREGGNPAPWSQAGAMLHLWEPVAPSGHPDADGALPACRGPGAVMAARWIERGPCGAVRSSLWRPSQITFNLGKVRRNSTF